MVLDDVRAKIKAIQNDSRYKQKPALVQINAPLALIQVDLTSRLSLLQWVEKALQPEDSTHADGEKWCDCPVQGFTVSHSKECKHYE